MAEPTKHYVQAPQGREITEDDALAMGYALFDAIAADQAEKARQDDYPDWDQPDGVAPHS